MSITKSPAEVEVKVDNVEASTHGLEEPTVNHMALLRKIDFKVLPMLFLIYVAAFLDRHVYTIGTCQWGHANAKSVSTSPTLSRLAFRKTSTS